LLDCFDCFCSLLFSFSVVLVSQLCLMMIIQLFCVSVCLFFVFHLFKIRVRPDREVFSGVLCQVVGPARILSLSFFFVSVSVPVSCGWSGEKGSWTELATLFLVCWFVFHDPLMERAVLRG